MIARLLFPILPAQVVQAVHLFRQDEHEAYLEKIREKVSDEVIPDF